MRIYTPKQAAQTVGIHDNTIRLWVKEYAAHLSASANPTSGQPRQLTPEDVAKLQAIKGWKDAGMPPETILERLATLTPESLQKPYIEATAIPQDTLQNKLQQPTFDNQALVVAVANIADVRSQVERVLDAVQELDRRIEERVNQVKEEVRRETDQQLLQYRNMLLVLGLFAILLGIAVVVLVSQ